MATVREGPPRSRHRSFEETAHAIPPGLRRAGRRGAGGRHGLEGRPFLPPRLDRIEGAVRKPNRRKSTSLAPRTPSPVDPTRQAGGRPIPALPEGGPGGRPEWADRPRRRTMRRARSRGLGQCGARVLPQPSPGPEGGRSAQDPPRRPARPDRRQARRPAHPADARPTSATRWSLGRRSYLSLRHGGGKTFLGVVHRLDKDTSGALALARSPEAIRAFQKLFRDHDIERQYLAVVEGPRGASRGRSTRP